MDGSLAKNADSSGKQTIYSESSIIRQKFDVVIPAYNEEDRIGPVLTDICSFISKNNLPWNVIVAIDGNDGTDRIVKEFSEQYPFIKSIKSNVRSGYGGAIKRGVREATGSYVILAEADGAMNFSTIIENLHYLSDYDIINFDRHSMKENKIPLTRRFLSRGYNIFIKILFDIDVKDLQGSYKIFRGEAIKALFKKTTITGAFFQAALFYHAKRLNLKVLEVEAPYTHKGGSKFSPGRMIIGGIVSGLALRVRNSPLYKYVPKSLVDLYYRKFRWM
ncbi:MAG: glycosyltransferase [Nitrososphaerota archaeon]